jgi:chromosome segregation ATPase
MKKQAEKPTYKELQKQLQEARSEAKKAKTELKRANAKIDDLELNVKLLEYLKDPKNSEKKSKLSPQWQKIADILLATSTPRKTS